MPLLRDLKTFGQLPKEIKNTTLKSDRYLIEMLIKRVEQLEERIRLLSDKKGAYNIKDSFDLRDQVAKEIKPNDPIK